MATQEMRQSEEFEMVVENMEEMHPRYLAKLLQEGTLEKVVEEKVVAYRKTLGRLVARMPLDSAAEIAQSEHLTPVNANWEDEKPLTPEEQNLLDKFWETIETT